MKACTVAALLGLVVVGVSGSAELLDMLGGNPEALISMTGIMVPSVDEAGPGKPQPCGVSVSAAVEEASKTCAAELMEGGGNGKRKKRRRNKKADENAVQKCVFEKLSLVSDDGTPVLADMQALIKTYGGDDSGKKIMMRMVEQCMGNIDGAPAGKKVGALMTCVKQSMREACPVHDLKKENPSLALMVAQKFTEKCMEGVDLPAQMVWSSVRCSAQQLQKLADTRLKALAPSRTRRSPKGGRGKKGNDDKNEGKGGETDKEEKNGDSRAERRQKRKEARKRQQEEELKMARERLERLVGPLDDALKSTGDSILATARCTNEATGVLDGDKVNGEKMKTLLSQATGSEKVRAVLKAAVDTCLAVDASSDAFTECIFSELTVTCPAAAAADRKTKQMGRRAGAGRRRQTAKAGRPAKVGRPKMPAALKMPVSPQI